MQTEVAETRQLITDNFVSQMHAARMLHFADRTVRWWCEHGAPPHILDALRRLDAGDITLTWARKLMRAKRTRRQARILS
jgi:hypothetical protein